MEQGDDSELLANGLTYTRVVRAEVGFGKCLSRCVVMIRGHTSHEGILLQMEEDVEQYVRTCLVCQQALSP